MKGKLILLNLIICFSINAQFNHNVGITFLANIYEIENYRVFNEVKTDFKYTDYENNYSIGLKYFIDYEKKYYFLRTSFDFNFIDLPPSFVKYYYNTGLTLIGGFKLFRFKMYGGVATYFNKFKYAKLNDTQLNKDLCLCELNHYNQLLISGFEMNFTNSIGVGFKVNFYPGDYIITEGLNKITKSRIRQFYAFYKF